MKSIKEYIILGLIIVAAAGYLLWRKTDRTHYRLPTLAPVSANDITKIQIDKGKRTVALERKEGKWFVGPKRFRADSGKVNDMLDALKQITLTAMVSDTKSYDRYDLGEKTRLHVRAWAKDRLVRDIDVGKAASTYEHTFVKLPDDFRVYHAQGNFQNHFDQAINALRDMTVLSFDRDKITAMTLTVGEKSLRIEKKAPEAKKPVAGKPTPPSPAATWTRADGKPVDAAKVDQLLSTLSRLQCESYIDDRKPDSFTHPVSQVDLSGGGAYRLAVFAKETPKAKNQPGVASGSQIPFNLSVSQVETIDKAIDGIVSPEANKKPEPPNIKSETQKK
jgi:hypothetical protein